MIATDIWNWLNQTIPTPLWFWFILALWIAFGAPHVEPASYKKLYSKVTYRIAHVPLPARRRKS